MKHYGTKFSYAAIALDGNEFEKCTFDNCTLTYKGGALPQVTECTITSCKWIFDEAAKRTMQWLAMLYEFDKTLGEAVIASIRGAHGSAD
jgi:hypothetical protein